MRGQPNGFWGKLEKGDDNRVIGWHPLIDHAADVAACMEVLLQVGLLRPRLARLAGLDDFDEAQVARLAFIAALHDIGKFNIGFQNKALDDATAPRAGHVAEALALFSELSPDRTRLLETLPTSELDAFGEDEAAVRLLLAAICHHGRPLPIVSNPSSRHWVPCRGLDPWAGMTELVARARAWFPARSRPTRPFPAIPALQHAFGGLTMLADWLGSDRDFFPYSESTAEDRISFARASAKEAVRRIGLDPRGSRASLVARGAGFDRVSAFQPRPAQVQILGLPPPHGVGTLTVLEAETGAGKTEAAAARFVRLLQSGDVDGMYFALPTRTASTQIFGRVVSMMTRAFPDEESRPPVVLAVPGYLAVDDRTGQRALTGFEVLWNDDSRERYRFRGWAAENPKRYTAGAVVVGTIDQILLSTLMVPHAHMRAVALLRQLLVVDEVHASDAYMTRLLESVLERHLRAGGHALLMSATLGSVALDRLVSTAATSFATPLAEALQRPYPIVMHVDDRRVELAIPRDDRVKAVSFVLDTRIDDEGAVARLALDAAMRGARVLVIRNTVAACVAVQRALEAAAVVSAVEHLLFRCGGAAAPHHARFAKDDRTALDHALEQAFGKTRLGGARVAIATQTVQQSLDLDADFLVTDLCPMDVMLQRVGRLHRHARIRPEGFERPTTVVLVPESPLVASIASDGTSRGRHGLGTVYDDLRILECTRSLLEARGEVEIPKLNRELVELATHPEALRALVGTDASWLRHAQRIDGTELAHRSVAALGLVDWTIEYGDDRIGFPDGTMERRLKTRLGEGDRLALFDVPFDGPFGVAIRQLTIPWHQSEGVPADAVPSPLDAGGEKAFRFRFGTRSFSYDRLGLRPIDDGTGGGGPSGDTTRSSGG